MIQLLRYFNFEPCLKLQWCRTRDLFGLHIPVTTGGFELRISCLRSNGLVGYVTTSYARDSRFKPEIPGTCDPNKSRARHHRRISSISFRMKEVEHWNFTFRNGKLLLRKIYFNEWSLSQLICYFEKKFLEEVKKKSKRWLEKKKWKRRKREKK